MTKEHFMALWAGNVTGAWLNNPSTLFWARSYQMEPDPLLQMSKDLLSIRGLKDLSNSSVNLAKHTIKSNCT